MEERRTGRSPAGRAGRARLALGVWSGDDATDVWVHWDICTGTASTTAWIRVN
jgi:hypothetical protein